MPDRICPFGVSILQNNHSCKNAQQIVRRGGAEISCTNLQKFTNCRAVYDHIKASALSSLGLDDDLLSIPHAQLVKIQCGGIEGLQHLLTDQGAELASNMEIWQLVEQAVRAYEDIEQIPCQLTDKAIHNFKLPKRRRKR